MPRTTIDVQVIGLAQLQALNTELVAHRTIMLSIQAVYRNFNAIVTQSTAIVKGNTTAQQQHNAAVAQSIANHQKQRTAVASVGAGFANVAAGILVVGVASAKFAAEFESNLSKVRNNTTMTNAEFANMRKSVLEIGSKSGQAFNDIAEGYMHAANFGYKFADAQKLVSIANMAAVATGTTTASTTQLLAKTMRENNIAVGDAAKTMNVLWYAAANSDAKMNQFVQTGGRAFAMAGAMGVSFNETAAAISLYNTKLKSSDATTQFIGDLSKLTHQTKTVHDALIAIDERIGSHLVQTFSLAGVRSVGLSGAFQQIRDAAQQMGVPVAELAIRLFPNLRGTIGALIGTSDSGMDGLKSRLKDIADLQEGRSNPIMARYDGQLGTAAQQFKVLSNTIKTEFLPVGQEFLNLAMGMIPVVKDVAGGVLAVMRAFDRLPKPVQEAVLGIGLLRIAMLGLGVPFSVVTYGFQRIIALLGSIPAAAAAARVSLAATSTAGGATGLLAGGGATGLLAAGARTLGPGALLIGGMYAAGTELVNRGFAENADTVRVTGSAGGQTSTHLYPRGGPDAVSFGTNPYGFNNWRAGQSVAATWSAPTLNNPFGSWGGGFNVGAGLPAGGGQPTEVAAAFFANNTNLGDGFGKAKKAGGGRGADPDIAGDRIRELDKAMKGKIYGQTHDDDDTQLHDAVESAHDYVKQGGNPQMAHEWLWRTQDAIRKKAKSSELSEQYGGISDYGASMLDTISPERGQGLANMAAGGKKLQSQFGGIDDVASSLMQSIIGQINSVPALRDQYQATQDSAQKKYEKRADQDLSDMAYRQSATMRDMATFYPNTPAGKMNTLQWQRSQQQDYISQLGNADTPFDSPKLEELLTQAKLKLDEINKSILDLTNKTAGNSPDARKQADTQANAFVSRLEAGYSAGAGIGKALGRNGGNLGGSIGALAEAFGPAGTNKYVNAISGGVGAYQAGQQQGAFGGAISGAASGAGIGAAFGPGGALVGAAAGGLLGLFGGLFGGHSTPRPIDKETNPSDYNSPSGMVEAAYRYRATGGKGWNATQLGLNLANPQLPPTVNVYVDGVKTAVQQQVTQQTSLNSSSLTNASINALQPV